MPVQALSEHCSLQSFLHAGERDIEQILEDLLDASYAIDEGVERFLGTKSISKGPKLKQLMTRGGKANIAKPISAIIIAQWPVSRPVDFPDFPLHPLRHFSNIPHFLDQYLYCHYLLVIITLPFYDSMICASLL